MELIFDNLIAIKSLIWFLSFDRWFTSYEDEKKATRSNFKKGPASEELFEITIKIKIK